MKRVKPRTKYGNPYTLGSKRSVKASKGKDGPTPQFASAVRIAFGSPVTRQSTTSQATSATAAGAAVAIAARGPDRRYASIAIGSATAAPMNGLVSAASAPRTVAGSHSPRRAWKTAPIESAISSDSGYTTARNTLVGKTRR